MVHPGTSAAWDRVISGQAGAGVKSGQAGAGGKILGAGSARGEIKWPGRGQGQKRGAREARRVEGGKSAPGCGAAGGVKSGGSATIGERGRDTGLSQKRRAG